MRSKYGETPIVNIQVLKVCFAWVEIVDHLPKTIAEMD